MRRGPGENHVPGIGRYVRVDGSQARRFSTKQGYETGIMYERTVDFLREVKTELSKVSWPSRNELIGSTTVVIIITLILAAFTGVIDFILSIILSYLLGA